MGFVAVVAVVALVAHIAVVSFITVISLVTVVSSHLWLLQAPYGSIRIYPDRLLI
jgi:hypothetical protein